MWIFKNEKNLSITLLQNQKHENKSICRQHTEHFVSWMLITVFRLQFFDNRGSA